MIYLTTYEAVKRLNKERIARSLTKADQPIDSFVKSPLLPDADVIEVVFGARCDEPAIGA